MTLYSAIIILVLVMDPLGNVPLFLSVLKHIPAKKRRFIILRESTIALLILTVFLLFGRYILEAMQISQPALSISGGIILFLIALRMIFPPETDLDKKLNPVEPFIVPLAVPLIAGPSAMTVVMLLATQAPVQHTSYWFVALVCAWFITTIILVCADHLGKMLGERGLTALERLMGMILTTMAVQMSLNGIQPFLNH